MILYAFWRSTASWRVRIALAHKGIDYELRPVHLRKDGGAQHREEYRALNPMRQVPMLETIEEDGTVLFIAQSMAIVEYLEERFPQRPLLPRDRAGRARVRQIAEAVNSGIQPLGNTSTQAYVRDVLKVDDVAWVRHWVTRGLEGLEATVRPTAGRFAYGDEVSLADAFIVPQLFFARRFGVDVEAYPTLAGVDRACAPLEAFVKAHARQQVDADSE